MFLAVCSMSPIKLASVGPATPCEARNRQMWYQGALAVSKQILRFLAMSHVYAEERALRTRDFGS